MTKSISIVACWLLSLSGLMNPEQGLAQSAQPTGTTIPLNDLSTFKSPGSNWRIVGSVRADLNKANVLTTDPGQAVLVYSSSTKGSSRDVQPSNLLTVLQHGDADLELDYLVAPQSNAGIYLQGRYGIQLADSWESRVPRVTDNGSVDERWDAKRTQGQNGYAGHPARQNVSRAPGLWQHLKVSFQAPRFNAQNQKTTNARLIRVELNGVAIHEDVELTGPTHGAGFADEQPLGPLGLQGNQGTVAFRNIRYVVYDKPRPELLNLKYTIYKGRFEKEGEFGGKAPESEGPSTVLSASVSRIPNEFLLRYTGTLRVSEPGEYRFAVGAPGGTSVLKINNQTVVQSGSRNGSSKSNLAKGDQPFELFYSKFRGGAQSALNLVVSGPGIREFTLGDLSSGNGGDVDPILVDASTNTILRSFIDVPRLPAVVSATSGEATVQTAPVRVVHAVSVGSPEQVHYSYDLDKGALMQVWRGLFLDTTPMWHDRGNGVSRPMGMVNSMGTPVLFLAQLSSPQAKWTTDTTGSGYRPKGYRLDENERPTFRYQSYGSTVADKIRVLEAGKGIQREVVVATPTSNLYARLASGKTISQVETGLYLVDGQQYVRLDDVSGSKPSVRESDGQQELIVPVTGGKLTYSILF